MRAGCSPACPCGLHMPSCRILCRWHFGRCCWSAGSQPCCCPGTQKAQATQIGQSASRACSLSGASLGLSHTGCSPPTGMVITCPASYWGQIPTGLPARSNSCWGCACMSPASQGPSPYLTSLRETRAQLLVLHNQRMPRDHEGRQHLLRSCPAQACCSASAWCRPRLGCRGPLQSCCCPKPHPLPRRPPGRSQDCSGTTVYRTVCSSV